jgi:hypothetical protein
MNTARYSQSTGQLWEVMEDGSTQLLGTGWAGNNEGKNNPAMQDVHDVGPLPRGLYYIGPPLRESYLGPYAMPLSPHPNNQMFGRDGFYIHGAAMDPEKRGQESRGCIVQMHDVRVNLWDVLGLRLIEVVM